MLDSQIAPRNTIVIAIGNLKQYTLLSVAGIDYGSVYALDSEFRSRWDDEKFYGDFRISPQRSRSTWSFADPAAYRKNTTNTNHYIMLPVTLTSSSPSAKAADTVAELILLHSFSLLGCVGGRCLEYSVVVSVKK